MSFLIVNSTASAAVATTGTFTSVLPTATIAGAVKNRGGHVMVVHGMAATFNFPKDFSVTWSGATGTVTYNGTTTIPAGSVIQIQWEMEGDDANFPYHASTNSNQADKVASAYRGSFGQIFRVDFGAPLAASTTAILNAGTATETLTTVQTLATPYVCDVPRAVSVVGGNAGDTTQTITVRGFDEYGVAMTETLSLNGTTTVNGKKAFKSVVSYKASATTAGTLSIGILKLYGLPYYLSGQGSTSVAIGQILKEAQDGTTPTAGTAIGGDLTLATATTGDVRGTYVPNTASDGTKISAVYMFVADPLFLGVPQYGA